MRSLVVFYSFSGTTRALAKKCANLLGADIAEVNTHRYGPTGWRVLRAAIDSWLGRLPKIEVAGPEVAGYDFILAMGPVWAGHAATPLRAHLARNKGRMTRLVFVLTCGGHCPSQAFDEMAALAGAKPEATFTILQKDLEGSSELPAALSAYLAGILQRKAA